MTQPIAPPPIDKLSTNFNSNFNYIQTRMNIPGIKIICGACALLGGFAGITILYFILTHIGGLPIHIDCATALAQCHP